MPHNGRANLHPPAEPGNTMAVKHAAYSPRLREPRAEEIADEIMAAPHTVPLDDYGAMEIGRMLALIEAIEGAIASKGVGNCKDLLEFRMRASGRLERWLAQYGLTPASRAAWAETLARGGLAAEIARRRAEGDGRG